MFSNIPFDKKLHFVAGFIATLLVSTLLTNIRAGIIAGVLIGIAKEVYDQITYGGFDYQDMLATWFGSAIAGLLYLGIT